MLETPVHRTHFYWAAPPSLTAGFGLEDTNVVHIFRASTRRSDFEINRIDVHGHTVLEWLHFYGSMPIATDLYFKMNPAQDSSDYCINLGSQWMQVTEAVSAIVAGRARWTEHDRKSLELSLEDAGAVRGNKVKPTTLTGVVVDLKGAANPRSSRGPAASMFSSLAMERGSRAVLSIRIFDSLVGTKPI